MIFDTVQDCTPVHSPPMMEPFWAGDKKAWDLRQPFAELPGQLGSLNSADHDAQWQRAVAGLDMALQPIVNIHTGACYGYEALLRNFGDAGFATPSNMFEVAHAAGRLADLEMGVREKSIIKFSALPNRDRAKLFINIDNRTLTAGGDLHARTQAILKAYALPETSIVFEISERHPLGEPLAAAAMLRAFRANNFRLAIDDFGTGFSGLQMLYFAEPDFLKIDRFFISDIAAEFEEEAVPLADRQHRPSVGGRGTGGRCRNRTGILCLQGDRL